jgi:putative transposase
MARLPRIVVPGLPLHIVQRGNARRSMFHNVADFLFFQECLGYAARRHSVAIHAYVFMTNHLHLLATPADHAGAGAMMQAIGRVYVPYFNGTYGRCGGLWEGRYRSTVVEDDRYFLTCMRYIELNPVRAGMVARPFEYVWSSFRANACGLADSLVTPHTAYTDLGATGPARASAYRALFDREIPARDLEFIRDSTQHGWALGGAAFRQRLTAHGRRAERAPMGRPWHVGAPLG